MLREKISKEFRLKNIDKAKHSFIVDIKQNYLISKNYKKT